MIRTRWYRAIDHQIRSWVWRLHELVGFPFQAFLRSTAGRWIRRNTEPNHWTLLRFPLTLVIALLLIIRQDGYAMAIYVLTVLTDRFDGELARIENKTSAFGTLLDTIADSTLQAAVMLSLSSRYPSIISGHPSWRLPLIAVGLEIVRLLGGLILRTLPYFADRLAAFEPNMSGKFKMAAMALSVLFILGGGIAIAQQLLAIAIALSIYSMARHLYDALTTTVRTKPDRTTLE